MLCIAAGGCYNDTQQELYGVTTQIVPCTDTAGVTYSVTISGIINANCNSCHGTPAAIGGNIVLSTYQDVITQVNNGNLMGDINHNAGHNAMPLTGAKLDACSIAKIQHWINIGKPNN